MFSLTLALASVVGAGLAFASLRGFGLLAFIGLLWIHTIPMLFLLLAGGCYYYFFHVL